MIRSIAEATAELVSLLLFVTMVALWAMILAPIA
jgi:hypothetical protein